MRDLGIETNKMVHMKLTSGFEIKGQLLQIVRHEGKALLMTFKDCRVSKGDKTYFDPSWGEFDMLLGDEVPSVYGGPADRESFGEHEISEPETTPARESPFSEFEISNFKRYQKLRDIRSTLTKKSGDAEAVRSLIALGEETYSKAKDEWLLMLEIYELGREQKLEGIWMSQIKGELDTKEKNGKNPDLSELVGEGLRIIH